jgi:hypothetical protein
MIPLALLLALQSVESLNLRHAIHQTAVGAYQLTPGFVEDVNRILCERRYIMEDRLSVAKSREMVCVYLEHYATPQRLGRPPSLRDMTLIFRFGPRGYLLTNQASVDYWNRVEATIYRRPSDGIYSRASGVADRPADYRSAAAGSEAAVAAPAMNFP